MLVLLRGGSNTLRKDTYICVCVCVYCVCIKWLRVEEKLGDLRLGFQTQPSKTSPFALSLVSRSPGRLVECAQAGKNAIITQAQFIKNV